MTDKELMTVLGNICIEYWTLNGDDCSCLCISRFAKCSTLLIYTSTRDTVYLYGII